MWKECGHPIGTRCNCASIKRDQQRAIRRLNATIRADNRRTGAGNKRRRHCAESAMAAAMMGDRKRARVWIAKLVSAGFSKEDGAKIEAMDCTGIEREMRNLLGIATPE